jgi:CRP-like cAMP-binding protein
MSALQKSDIRNRLLLSMSDQDFVRLAPHLEHRDLPRRFVLSVANQWTDHTYFLQSGIASIVVESPDGRAAEVCIVGSEGMVPTNAILGAASLPYSIFMQVAGSGLRILNAQLVAAFSENISLRNLLTRYVQAASIQTAYTAFSNASRQIEQRLARWILMCHDRTDGDAISLTHEFLSVMLAVRRQSVTTTLHILEEKHLVVSSRGVVIVRDRKGLEALAGDAYGVPEREYEDLIRPAT